MKMTEISFRCGMPAFVDDMVGCENRKCRRWYHLRCVGVRKIYECSWACDHCEKKNTLSTASEILLQHKTIYADMCFMSQDVTKVKEIQCM